MQNQECLRRSLTHLLPIFNHRQQFTLSLLVLQLGPYQLLVSFIGTSTLVLDLIVDVYGGFFFPDLFGFWFLQLRRGRGPGKFLRIQVAIIM